MFSARKSGLTLTFEHETWKLIGIIFPLRATPAPSLVHVLIKWRVQKILSGQHLVYRPTDKRAVAKQYAPFFKGGIKIMISFLRIKSSTSRTIALCQFWLKLFLSGRFMECIFRYFLYLPLKMFGALHNLKTFSQSNWVFQSKLNYLRIFQDWNSCNWTKNWTKKSFEINSPFIRTTLCFSIFTCTMLT